MFTNCDSGTTVYLNLTHNGYRLPTEAEWGRLSGRRSVLACPISADALAKATELAEAVQARRCSALLLLTANNSAFRCLPRARAFVAGSNATTPNQRRLDPLTLAEAAKPGGLDRCLTTLCDDTIQASHRKYQCLGLFGFAGEGSLSFGSSADMVLIFTTRLRGIAYPPPSVPMKL